MFNTINANKNYFEIHYFELVKENQDKDIATVALRPGICKITIDEGKTVDEQTIADFLQQESTLITYDEIPRLFFKVNEYRNEAPGSLSRKLFGKIMMGSNLIAMKSRIGPADLVFIHPQTYQDYLQPLVETSDYTGVLEYVFNSSIDKNIIYIARKGKVSEKHVDPGYYVAQHNDNSILVKVGYFPQKTLQKIVIE